METIKKRDYGFDNTKFLLIFLVVFGHILEEISLSGWLGIIRAVIYSFHMPLFVFISGYFSKSSINKVDRAFTDYLVPFFIFNTLFAIMIQYNISINIFLPQYAFWYLLSLFFWNISIDYISKFKLLLVVSFLLGIYCGFFDNIDRLFSLSRTICFFPYFILGYGSNKERIDKWRSMNKALPIAGIVICTFITAFANYKGLIPVKMYEMLQSYAKTEVDTLAGSAQRALIYMIALVMIVSVISLIPNKEYFFTKFGTRTISIYIFSSFLIKAIFSIIKRFALIQSINCVYMEIVISLLLTVLIIVLTGNKWVYKLYINCIVFIKKAFMRP